MARTAIQVVSTGGLYGAERVLLDLAAYLQEQGWISHVVAVEGAGAQAVLSRAKAMGISAEAFSTGRLGVSDIVSRLRAVLRRHDSGVVHSHGYKPDILLSLPGVSSGWRRISTCHTWYRETWKMRAWEYLDKRVLRGFDAVAAVSAHIEQELLEAGVSRVKVHKIDNGIDAPGCDPLLGAKLRAEFGIAPEAPLVVQIGRLAPSKRNDLVLQALAKMPRDVCAIFAGEGEERGAVERLACELGVSGRIRMAGYRTDVLAFLSAADAMVISSDHEGLPIVLLEAMAAQCPIVSTRVGDIGNVLLDGRDGWLVPPGDADALAAALTAALVSPDEARARAQSAFFAFESRHSRRAMGTKYLQLYEAG